MPRTNGTKRRTKGALSPSLFSRLIPPYWVSYFIRKMKLSTAQLNRFRDDGCIWFEGFFTPRETRALRLELARMYDVELKSGRGINCAVQEDGTTRDDRGERQNLQVIPLNKSKRSAQGARIQPESASRRGATHRGRLRAGTGSSVLEAAQGGYRYKLASGQRLF